jgi:hypothetical protein
MGKRVSRKEVMKERRGKGMRRRGYEGKVERGDKKV